MNSQRDPQATHLCRGRALHVGQQGQLYVSRHYVVYRSDDCGTSWVVDARVPTSGWKPLVAKWRFGARLLRYYIAAFQVLDDGSRVAVARDGIYRAGPGELTMVRTFRYTRGSRPLNLAADGNRVLFGEYGNLDDCRVVVYVSEDSGRTFNVGYQFPLGDVRHVHNVLLDRDRGHYWVLAGDFGRQTGIAALSRDMKALDWINRGTQQCRAVGAVNMPNRLIYGTDSDRERNFIVTIDKQSGRVDKLREVEGSSLYASSFGKVHAISTCVEPNPACPARECSLYTSTDGNEWTRLIVHVKDPFGMTLFQFGTIVLPNSCCAETRGIYSGQAVKEVDDAVCLLRWD
jgi:hypothetical protein